MSRIDRLLAKPKDYEINGEIFTIYPLTIRELPVIVKMGDDSKKAEAIDQMIRATLKRSVPDVTDEEINQLPMEFVQKITEAIMEVNHLRGE